MAPLSIFITTGTADDYIRLVPVEFGLCDADSSIEIVVGKSRVEDSVAVGLEVGRLEAA
ncbi:MAG: hypothetical protein ACYC6N_00775 [Pirellulaceae bacterium]